MMNFGDIDRENALHAIDDMIERGEKAQAKFAVGTAQYSLQVNRIHALRVARALILQEAAAYTQTDLERAKTPLASLISKSEKALGKLKEESWQRKMLHRNLEALYLARALLESAYSERWHSWSAMNRDDYINSVTIGERASLEGEVLLADYHPDWAVLFQNEAKRIKITLGDKALGIHHVGSTSVPGLCAKPIIDILLLVRDSADEADYVPPMEAAGYILRIREPDWHEHRLFKRPDTHINLHVFSEGCSEAARMLAFRNRLRTHTDDCELYAATKRELAKRTWTHIQHYADAKSEVVAEILSRVQKKY